MHRRISDPGLAPLGEPPRLAPSAATICLWLGVVGMFTWLVPLIGMAAPAVGLAAGLRGWRAPDRARARLGLVLSSIALAMGLLMLYWCSLIHNFDPND